MQVFANKENIGTISKTGNTTVQLSPSVITLGAKQYNTGTLNCDLSTSGAEGLDTGSIVSWTAYYIYAILDGTEVKLIASLSNSQPLGFTLYKLVGGIFTNSSSQIEEVGALDSNNQLKPTIAGITEHWLGQFTVSTSISTVSTLHSTINKLITTPASIGGDLEFTALRDCTLSFDSTHTDTNNLARTEFYYNNQLISNALSTETTLRNVIGGGGLSMNLSEGDTIRVNMNNQSSNTCYANLVVSTNDKYNIG